MSTDPQTMWSPSAALAIVLPIVLFPYSRTVWIALDLSFNSPGANPERYLRGQEMRQPPSSKRE
ncbi:MAG: hypothetical protein H0V24_05020 [Chloroflexia bacterium]|nr:hypothetical protein [Chloroflexia bacterium]MDQ3411218.1 hypothetical protein [Chloroflexota bacterium]